MNLHKLRAYLSNVLYSPQGDQVAQECAPVSGKVHLKVDIGMMH